jgi:hypothetical protein
MNGERIRTGWGLWALCMVLSALLFTAAAVIPGVK